MLPLQWRHIEHDDVSNHLPYDCLLNRLFSRRSEKTSKLRVTSLCEGNSPLWPMISPHKGPVTRKMFWFDDVTMHQDVFIFQTSHTSPKIISQRPYPLVIKWYCVYHDNDKKDILRWYWGNGSRHYHMALVAHASVCQSILWPRHLAGWMNDNRICQVRFSIKRQVMTIVTRTGYNSFPQGCTKNIKQNHLFTKTNK